ncbi:hypothetical protein C8J56DRAFT_1109525 [Mycena floridula]|nr:hypothetical protein C8J56DRAFT_1109525 [Mycena floridula]
MAPAGQDTTQPEICKGRKPPKPIIQPVTMRLPTLSTSNKKKVQKKCEGKVVQRDMEKELNMGERIDFRIMKHKTGVQSRWRFSSILESVRSPLDDSMTKEIHQGEDVSQRRRKAFHEDKTSQLFSWRQFAWLRHCFATSVIPTNLKFDIMQRFSCQSMQKGSTSSCSLGFETFSLALTKWFTPPYALATGFQHNIA